MTGSVLWRHELIVRLWPCTECGGTGLHTSSYSGQEVCSECGGQKGDPPGSKALDDIDALIAFLALPSRMSYDASKRTMEFLQDVAAVLQIGERHKRVTRDDVQAAIKRVGVRRLDKMLESTCSGSSRKTSSTSTTTKSSSQVLSGSPSVTPSSTSSPSPTSSLRNPCGEIWGDGSKLEVTSMENDLEVTDFVDVTKSKPSSKKLRTLEEPPTCLGNFSGEKKCRPCDWRKKCLSLGVED